MKIVLPNQSLWQGRKDGETIERFHQLISLKSYDAFLHDLPYFKSSVVIVGFSCDEGVKRNQGRLGAKEGPYALRQALANYPLHNDNPAHFIDVGDIVCIGQDLETAQQELGQVIAKIVEKNCLPLVLGGGHETAWGHYLGLHQKYGKENFAIVNFDAHFDMRPLLHEQGNSGTSFLQIAELRQQIGARFDYYCVGIKASSNTKSLYEMAKKWDVKYITCDAIYKAPASLSHFIQTLITTHEAIYITVCLDVFASCFSPGVSAASPYGLAPWHVLEALHILAASGKTVALDIVELAPPLDKDHQSAKLGALCIAEFFYHWKPSLS